MIHHVLYLFGSKKKKKLTESNREANNRYDRNMLLHVLQVFQANVLSLQSQCYTELNIYFIEGFLCGPVVKKLHVMQEMQVQLLGQEDPLE